MECATRPASRGAGTLVPAPRAMRPAGTCALASSGACAGPRAHFTRTRRRWACLKNNRVPASSLERASRATSRPGQVDCALHETWYLLEAGCRPQEHRREFSASERETRSACSGRSPGTSSSRSWLKSGACSLPRAGSMSFARPSLAKQANGRLKLAPSCLECGRLFRAGAAGPGDQVQVRHLIWRERLQAVGIHNC